MNMTFLPFPCIMDFTELDHSEALSCIRPFKNHGFELAATTLVGGST